jgi:hypothetical protein
VPLFAASEPPDALAVVAGFDPHATRIELRHESRIVCRSIGLVTLGDEAALRVVLSEVAGVGCRRLPCRLRAIQVRPSAGVDQVGFGQA